MIYLLVVLFIDLSPLAALLFDLSLFDELLGGLVDAGWEGVEERRPIYLHIYIHICI
jgi:hypothetical protein